MLGPRPQQSAVIKTAAANSEVSKNIRVGLCGIAGYGDTYLESLLNKCDRLRARLVGVVDPMPQRCRRLAELQKLDVPIHHRIERLFEQTQVDLMLRATPIHLHAPPAC